MEVDREEERREKEELRGRDRSIKPNDKNVALMIGTNQILVSSILY